jgi:hypothetical protein
MSASGPSGLGRTQRVAVAPQDPGGVALAVAELPGQARLADPGLTADEGHAPAAGPRLGEPAVEGVEDGRPLEELHVAPMVTAHRASTALLDPN